MKQIQLASSGIVAAELPVFLKTRKEYEAYTGKKLKFRERLAYNMVRRAYKKQLKAAEKGMTTEPSKTLATIGFACSLIALLGFVFPPLFILWIPGLVINSIAIHRANRDPDNYGGKGLAVAGLVLSLGLVMLFIIAVVALAAGGWSWG